MIEYFMLFCVVMTLTLFAQAINKRNNITLSVICVLILSLFAGLRNLNVGTDINIYGERIFSNCGIFMNLKSYLNFHNVEQGYLLLNYLVYYFTKNIHVFFFVLQLISASVIFIIVKKEKETGTMWMIVLAYLLLWYGTTFNILRQSIAIAICLLSFYFIEKRKYFKYILAVLIASFFHKSSFICLVIPLLDYLSNTKLKTIYTIVICMGLVTLYNSLDIIKTVIINVLPIFTKYVGFFDVDVNIPNINWPFAIFKIMMLLFILFFSGKIKNKGSNNLLINIAILDVLLYCSSAVIKYGYRTSYFFLPHLIILIPRIDCSLRGQKERIIFRLGILVLMFMYWFLRYVIIKYDGIIPYSFFWSE